MKISPMAYYLYLIFDRRNEFSIIVRAQRPFPKLLVGKNRKIEKGQLLQKRPTRHRDAYYTSLRDHFCDAGAALDEGED